MIVCQEGVENARPTDTEYSASVWLADGGTHGGQDFRGWFVAVKNDKGVAAPRFLDVRRPVGLILTGIGSECGHDLR